MKMNPMLRLMFLSCPTMIGTFLFTFFFSDSATAVEVKSTDNSITSPNPSPTNLQCDRSDCTGNNYLAAFPQIDSTTNDNVEEFPNVQENEAGHLLLDVSESTKASWTWTTICI